MSEIRLRSAAKRFGVSRVLDDVNLTVPEGSMTAILGASGSGKTTLLRIIAGFERLDSGELSIGGQIVDDANHAVPAQHRRIGYVPQDGALFPNLSAVANIAFGLPRRDRARADQLLELVGLTGLGARRPHQLSGGQQQRVALARALAVRPSVILLDEPFSSLDASMRASVRRDVARILAETGTTTILVTHDQDEALSMADQVALLQNGRILAAAPPRDLYSAPATAAVANSLGQVNVLIASLHGTTAQCVLGEISLAEPTVSDRGLVLVRAENIDVRDTRAPGLVAATVTRFDYFGHDSVVHLEVPGAPGDRPVQIVARIVGDRMLTAGQHVWLGTNGPGRTLPVA
ncbi:MAG TPA: ABC transporter ATP-binding protein [Galbitalea sp.]